MNNNQTPDQFISTLQSLATGLKATPEFTFMTALKKELEKNHFDRDASQRLAAQLDIPLPAGTTQTQAEDMAYHVATLVASCHDALNLRGGFDGPDVEAAALALRLVREALI